MRNPLKSPLRKSIVLACAFLLSLLAFQPAMAQGKAKKPRKMDNETLVVTALDAVFNLGDTSAVLLYWSEDYVQHNPQFPNGRDVILNFARTRPAGLKFEPGLVMSKGDLVMVHSRYTGFGPNPMVIVDILRVRKGRLIEHWDIMQEEVPADKSANGNGMFPIR